jgi:hypothetical protein
VAVELGPRLGIQDVLLEAERAAEGPGDVVVDRDPDIAAADEDPLEEMDGVAVIARLIDL